LTSCSVSLTDVDILCVCQQTAKCDLREQSYKTLPLTTANDQYQSETLHAGIIFTQQTSHLMK